VCCSRKQSSTFAKNIKMKRVFKRKFYDRLKEWKETRNGKTAIAP